MGDCVNLSLLVSTSLTSQWIKARTPGRLILPNLVHIGAKRQPLCPLATDACLLRNKPDLKWE